MIIKNIMDRVFSYPYPQKNRKNTDSYQQMLTYPFVKIYLPFCATEISNKLFHDNKKSEKKS